MNSSILNQFLLQYFVIVHIFSKKCEFYYSHLYEYHDIPENDSINHGILRKSANKKSDNSIKI